MAHGLDDTHAVRYFLPLVDTHALRPSRAARRRALWPRRRRRRGPPTTPTLTRNTNPNPNPNRSPDPNPNTIPSLSPNPNPSSTQTPPLADRLSQWLDSLAGLDPKEGDNQPTKEAGLAPSSPPAAPAATGDNQPTLSLDGTLLLALALALALALTLPRGGEHAHP